MLESLIFILAAMCSMRSDFTPKSSGALAGFGLILVLGATQALHLRPLNEPTGLLPFTLARPQTLYALFLWASLAALLWSATGIFRWEGALRRASWAIFVIGLFIALVGILQRGQGNTAYFGLRPIRYGHPFGPFTNYNHAATWMVASVFVGAGLFAGGFQRGDRTPLTERVAQQILIAFALAILIAAILETGSRGGVIALFVSALATAFLTAGSFGRAWVRRLTRASLVLTGAAYVVLLYTHLEWIGLAGGGLDHSATYRISMYRSGLRLFMDFPIFGVGLGAFANAFHSYKEPFIAGFVDHIHSSWLEIALETGSIGLISFGAAVFWPLAVLGRRLSAETFHARALAAGWFAALMAFSLHGLLEFSFQIPAGGILFIVLVAASKTLLQSSIKTATSTSPDIVMTTPPSV